MLCLQAAFAARLQAAFGARLHATFAVHWRQNQNFFLTSTTTVENTGQNRKGKGDLMEDTLLSRPGDTLSSGDHGPLVGENHGKTQDTKSLPTGRHRKSLPPGRDRRSSPPCRIQSLLGGRHLLCLSRPETESVSPGREKSISSSVPQKDLGS